MNLSPESLAPADPDQSSSDTIQIQEVCQGSLVVQTILDPEYVVEIQKVQNKRNGWTRLRNRLTQLLILETEFKEDQRHGKSRFYFEDSSLVQRECHYEYDRLQGICQLFYPNGKVESSFFYVQDQMNGEFLSYDLTGDLVVRCGYQKGLLHGEYQTYSKNKVVSRVFYDHGIQIH
jgi:antitoxin component YwqK of YwqJK toxin-antitoxin module